MAAWTAYWVTECFFCSIWPRFREADAVFADSDWKASLVLLAAYLAAGAILGGLAGIAMGAWDRLASRSSLHPAARLQRAVVLTIVVTFGCCLIPRFPHRNVAAALLLCSAGIAIGLLASMLPLGRSALLKPLSSPWATCIALTGTAWILGDPLLTPSRPLRHAEAAIFLLFVFAATYIARRRWPLRVEDGNGRVASSVMRLCNLAVPVILFLSFMGLRDRFATGISIPHTGSVVAGLPNIVLITMDTVRADHLPVYGYARDTTPSLRQLSSEAAVFRHVFAPSDMTLPSHASIFTGLYPSWHGAHYDARSGYPYGRPLLRGQHTLARILSERGYFTAGVAANYLYLGHHYRLTQGFQHYVQPEPVSLLKGFRAHYIRNPARRLLSRFLDTADFDLSFLRAANLDRFVAPVLETAAPSRRPLFLFVNYMDAHAPYIPPAPFDTAFPGWDMSFSLEDFYALQSAVLHLKRSLSEKERRHLSSQYDGGIASIDSSIGKLIGKLKAAGLYENCLFVVTSDHGEAFGQKGLVEHALGMPYQDQIHVPLIIKYPHRRSPSVIDEPVSLTDLFPTILETAGCPSPAGIQGRSLIRGRGDPQRLILIEAFAKGGARNSVPRFRIDRRALCGVRLKFVKGADGSRELYDFISDPAEERNLLSSAGEVARQFEAGLAQIMTSAPRHDVLPDKTDRKMLDRLRSLGYAQ